MCYNGSTPNVESSSLPLSKCAVRSEPAGSEPTIIACSKPPYAAKQRTSVAGQPADVNLSRRSARRPASRRGLGFGFAPAHSHTRSVGDGPAARLTTSIIGPGLRLLSEHLATHAR